MKCRELRDILYLHLFGCFLQYGWILKRPLMRWLGVWKRREKRFIQTKTVMVTEKRFDLSGCIDLLAD